MENFKELSKNDLILINGGSEESYQLGYKVGYFIGGFVSNTLHAMNALVEGIKEAAEVLDKIK